MILKKPSCEKVYPSCNKYINLTIESKCPCCGSKIQAWGVFNPKSEEGFTGFQCTECEWECADD